jgi:hypothetical protein
VEVAQKLGQRQKQQVLGLRKSLNLSWFPEQTIAQIIGRPLQNF